MLVIRPPYPLDIGTMEKDPKELKRVYNIGVKEAQNCLKAVQSYLKNNIYLSSLRFIRYN